VAAGQCSQRQKCLPPLTHQPHDLLKRELRTAILARRDALTEDARRLAAQRLAVQAGHIPLDDGMIVAGYMPIRSEIDPRPLMEALRARGARLALPAIVGKHRPLAFRAWAPDAALEAGPFGTLHPADDAAPVAPDIVLVPLVAFDRTGHRIGYGGGFYDRTLARLRRDSGVMAVGVAFDMQEIETVPASPHDVILDRILTDRASIILQGQ